MPIQLVLADDHPLVLNGLMQLFANEPDIEVLACCTDGEAALQSVTETQPEILLLDLRMPKLDGISVLQALRKLETPIKVIVLTAGVDENEISKAIQLGAQGVVLKEAAPETLLKCVRKVHAGGKWLDADNVLAALARWQKQEADQRQLKQILTAREMNLVELVANGYSNKQIADHCFISEGTVKVHLHNVYEKLGIKSRLELCLYAREKGLG
ncbi:response regulator [Methylomonas rapida]|uniref:Response regulator transcription factor n=1 Tax=Methylomonas rapida TaxID=2963939 RepID=A0ABY7GN47_9GAMM|nr:response regulator transcription factor [Methylomonas rapida]WAR45915.1 response regulator transcription factor [Methylomonas rapida]